MARPPVLRTKSATTKVTEAEYARLESLAERSGVNMSEWMRGRLLGRDGADRDEDTATVLGEVLALRTILINLLFSVSNGKPVTPEAMKELIEKADGDKARRAMERLTAAVPKMEATTEGAEPEAGGGLRWRSGDGRNTRRRGRAGGRSGGSGRSSRRRLCSPGC